MAILGWKNERAQFNARIQYERGKRNYLKDELEALRRNNDVLMAKTNKIKRQNFV